MLKKKSENKKKCILGVVGKNSDKKILLWSSTLCFLSGFLNSLGFLKFNTSVSHVTGSFTKLSIDVIDSTFYDLSYLIILVFCFFFGAIISGLLIGEREFSLRKRYGMVVMGIGIGVSFFWLLLGDNKLFVFILSFFSGIQNGIFITYKGVIVRTTHVTGGITDLGVLIGRYLKHKKVCLWRIRFQLAIITGFFLGGASGTMGYSYLYDNIFYILSLSYILVGSIYFIWRKQSMESSE